MHPERIITLTTDFGLQDEYAGVMKGVILSRAPGTTIVDLTHEIPAQDIRTASFTIRAAFRYFPDGTIHVLVVDPGVGGDRKIALVRAAGHIFLAPDNGILTPCLDREIFQEARLIHCSHLYNSPVSATFHGRDIFAPVAAAIAVGTPFGELGESVAPDRLTRIHCPEPEPDPAAKCIWGEIIHQDRFGNLTTNIDIKTFSKVFSTHNVSIRTGKIEIRGISPAYSAVSPGAPLALFGSRDLLEISLCMGNAARDLNLGPGMRVCITKTP